MNLDFFIGILCLIIWIWNFIFKFWKLLIQFFKELVELEIWYLNMKFSILIP
jgi:hypothetical protein